MSLTMNLKELNKDISADGQQQSALVRLGQLALSDISPLELMKEAAFLATQFLPVEYCLVWELLEHEKHFLLMAEAGFHDGAASRVQTPVEPRSMKGFTLTSEDPVIVENIREEKRFRTTSLGLEYARSAASVVIGTVEKPYGVLEVFSQQLRSFSENDIFFLRGIANLIGLVLRQVRKEEDLVRDNEHLHKEMLRAQYMTPAGHFQWDRFEVKNRLIESREKERRHLAQELHDVPIQELYGLMYQLDELKDSMQDQEDGNIVEEFKKTLSRVINSLRTICRELRPASLSPFGLEVAIRDHVEKFCDQTPNIKVHLELMRDKDVLSDSLRFSLFRIYQQAIHNVARHAEATEAFVRFSWDEDMIILEVEDNGKGFEVPQQWGDLLKEEHFGLLGMAERVEIIRGKLEINSTPGKGTRIRALVPRP